MKISDWAGKALTLLFPVSCPSCGKSDGQLHPKGALCGKCQAAIHPMRPPFCPQCGRSQALSDCLCNSCQYERFFFDRAYTCAYYEGAMKSLIYAFKFHRKRFLANELSDLMENFYKSHLQNLHFDAVAAIPLDQSRMRDRGFNQAELLSKKLAARIGLRDVTRYVKREGHGATPQSLLTKRDRRQNVAGAFTHSRELPHNLSHILLIDDLLTTGHTASECAKALKHAGAKEVTVLALARSFWS